MNYKVIASGSTGNAVLYHDKILVDCGVSFSQIKPYLRYIQIILLTHAHQDHFNLKTIQKIVSERPTIRIGCCEWLRVYLEVKNLDVYEIGETYNYGLFKIIPIKLYHDLPNCGYRILTDNYKIIHATDTAHLEGIEAKGYDLFAIEHNYDEETVFKTIESKELNGQFAYEKAAINSHLSEQKAREFIYKNKGEKYEVLRLHESNIKTL